MSDPAVILDGLCLHNAATEVRQLRADLAAATARAERAERELADWHESARAVEADRPDEVHCACAGILRKQLADVRRERDEAMRDMAAMQQDAKDYIELADKCDALMRERDEARAALCDCADYHHQLWGDEAGMSWREQQNERAARWRKAAGNDAQPK